MWERVGSTASHVLVNQGSVAVDPALRGQPQTVQVDPPLEVGPGHTLSLETVTPAADQSKTTSLNLETFTGSSDGRWITVESPPCSLVGCVQDWDNGATKSSAVYGLSVGLSTLLPSCVVCYPLPFAKNTNFYTHALLFFAVLVSMYCLV